jgi:hypothetical protein
VGHVYAPRRAMKWVLEFGEEFWSFVILFIQNNFYLYESVVKKAGQIAIQVKKGEPGCNWVKQLQDVLETFARKNCCVLNTDLGGGFYS